jgi:hypothetical protein
MKFDTLYEQLLQEAPVSDISDDVDTAAFFDSKKGSYGNYKVTSEQVDQIIQKLEEVLPSEEDWKEFRKERLVPIVTEITGFKGLRAERAARVIYDTLRTNDWIQDEKSGYSFKDSFENDEETPKDDPITELTQTQEDILNYVREGDGSVERKELENWLKEQNTDEDGNLDESKYTDSLMDLRYLLQSKQLQKNGTTIFMGTNEAEEENEESDVPELEFEDDKISQDVDEHDIIQSYIKGMK